MAPQPASRPVQGRPALDLGLLRAGREKLAALRGYLVARAPGREDVVDALILALVAGEHVVVIGPPGTAKTMLIRLTAEALRAKAYIYQLTRYTEYSELFGPLDINELVQGRVARRWTRIVEAEIVFLDEIFKANSAILNSLLSLMQERIVYDPQTGTEKKAQLWTLIGASNETPMDEELQALYDRFTIKVFIRYISGKKLEYQALMAAWGLNNGAPKKPLPSMDDIRSLNAMIHPLLTTPIKSLGNQPLLKVYYTTFMPFFEELRKQGIPVSDRTRLAKAPKIYAAYLIINGVSLANAMNAPLDLLRYFVQTPDQLPAVTKAIEEAMAEVAEMTKKLEEAKRAAKMGNLDQAIRALEDILAMDVSKIADKPYLRPRAEAIIDQARKLKRKYEEIKAKLEMLDEDEDLG